MASMFVGHILLALFYIFPNFANPTHHSQLLFCSIVSVIAVTLIAVINLHLMVASLDRLMMMKLFRYRRHYSGYRTIIVIIGIIWFFSILLGILPLFLYRSIQSNNCQTWQIISSSHEITFHYVVIVFIFIIPIIVMVSCYTCIFKMVRRTINHHYHRDGNWVGGEHRVTSFNQRKVSITLTMTMILYIIMWSPFFICYIIAINPFILSNILKMDDFYMALKIAQYLAFCYPAVNPVAYALLSNEIRTTIRESMRNFAKVSPIA
ncbi:Histamine H2 receptor [Trichoplax sp. H2]|nr:Histamine H2 receptor [Trichoplax sp. H2]|eukprot:RDD40625.1 Histamine H2 receptor [Trichoplax sp. H2]